MCLQGSVSMPVLENSCRQPYLHGCVPNKSQEQERNGSIRVPHTMFAHWQINRYRNAILSCIIEKRWDKKKSIRKNCRPCMFWSNLNQGCSDRSVTNNYYRYLWKSEFDHCSNLNTLSYFFYVFTYLRCSTAPGHGVMSHFFFKVKRVPPSVQKLLLKAEILLEALSFSFTNVYYT